MLGRSIARFDGIHQHVLIYSSDAEATRAALRASGIQVKGEPEDHGYGITVMVTLPGGVNVQVYEPRHPLAISPQRTV